MFSDVITSQVSAEHRRDLRAAACRSQRSASARRSRSSVLTRALRSANIASGRSDGGSGTC
jgi:hypothetical protein